jgi:hypothetical protein
VCGPFGARGGKGEEEYPYNRMGATSEVFGLAGNAEVTRLQHTNTITSHTLLQNVHQKNKQKCVFQIMRNPLETKTLEKP